MHVGFEAQLLQNWVWHSQLRTIASMCTNVWWYKKHCLLSMSMVICKCGRHAIVTCNVSWHCSVRPAFCSVRPIHCSARPARCSARPAHCSSSPLFCSSSPMFCSSSPLTFKCIMCVKQNRTRHRFEFEIDFDFRNRNRNPEKSKKLRFRCLKIGFGSEIKG